MPARDFQRPLSVGGWLPAPDPMRTVAFSESERSTFIISASRIAVSHFFSLCIGI